MKPSNWDSLKPTEKSFLATSLLKSMRGNLIISQALVVAISAMKKVPKNRREVSNIQDMEMLLELFPIFRVVVESNKAFREMTK